MIDISHITVENVLSLPSLTTKQEHLDEIKRRSKLVKFPPLSDFPKAIQEIFAKYYNPKQTRSLAQMLHFDPDALALMLKFHPEIENEPWATMAPAETKAKWDAPAAKVIVSQLWYPELTMDFGRPYREIVHLPRKAFAQAVLKCENMYLKCHFDLDQLAVWAGYKKPDVVRAGNVYQIGKR